MRRGRLDVSLIGAPIDRVDGHLKVTGRASYAADVSIPRMAHAVMVLSTIPCGRISGVDSTAAANMPGVFAVLSHLNAPALPQKGNAGVNPPAGRVLSLLQDNEVHYNRQPIAVVVADTLDQAGAAAARVKVAYESAPAQLDFAQGQRSAHAPPSVNQEPTDSERGTSAFGEIAAQIEGTYTTPMEHHNPMEPHATVAHWQGDQLTLYDSTQYIAGCRNTIAKIFGIQKEKVRVICPYVGGGFGCKGSTWSHVPLAAMAARQVGRPVKLVLERPQMFGPVGGRPQTEQRVVVAANSQGGFVGMRHDSYSHTSMFEDFTEPAALQTRILYSCPNLKTSHRLVPLNVATPTFQRAPGHATGTFALESAIDELAYKLGMDPIELRLRNEPEQDPDKQLPWSLRALRECYSSGARDFGWSSRTPAPGSMRDGANLVGWGVATATYPANRQPANASARLMPDGTVVVQSGTQDLGTGTYTIMTQIAAETLGFPLHRVRFELGDSLLPEAPVSGGSMSAASVGPAVQAAARALREKLIELAIGDDSSPVFGAAPDGIIFDNGNIGLSTKQRREPITATLARRGGRPIEVFSSAKSGEEKKQYSMHSFGAVFAAVHIDPELRIIRVPRVVARYDIGRLLNAKTGRSQLIGGIVWGIGMALMEQSVLDERNGRIINANLAEYHVPTNADIGEIDVNVLSESDPYINPLGARGIGEIGITGIAAALANAVHHATGVRVRDLPITLDKLLDSSAVS